jgi:GT2 family glycosyltransferase
LPSVLLTASQHEIVVADNFSSDESIAFLQKNFPSVRIISLTRNWGFAKGYNEALKQVTADYYVILNSDVEVRNNWLEPMIALLENDLSIAACQPKILSYHHQNMFEYAGAAGGWIDKYGYPFSKGRVFEICEEDRGQYDLAQPIFWASGAALFIRAPAFHEMKGFDEYFFAHQEEIDLCWRLQLAGHKIYSCPSAVVYHVGGGTLPRGNSQKTYLNFRNNLVMLAKNLPLSKKITVIPLRFLLDWVAALKGLLTGDGGYFVAIAKAHFSFVSWCIFHRKKNHLPLSRSGHLYGYFQKSIVWRFFIKRKRTFSEIVQGTL